MKTKSTKKRILISVCAVVVVAAILAVLLLPGVSQKDVKNYSYVAKTQSGVENAAGFDITVQASDSSELVIDSKTGSVALLSADAKTVFNSCSGDAAERFLANVLNIRLRDKYGNSYTMNSTDNSVAFGAFEVAKENKTKATVKFNLFPDKERAQKGVEGADVFASVTVTFSYENGGFKASVNTTQSVLPEDFYIEKLSILPGLFSVSHATGDEFYTLPDGCGAVMDLSAVTAKPITLDLGVYGSDVAFYDYSQGAVLPFFAMTKNGSLVNTIISSGDALSEIFCEKFADGGGYLYNVFNVTACGMVDGKLRVGEPYEGELSQIYTIISGEKADYNDIAEQVRDNLVNRGYLPGDISDKFIDLPFFINVLGSADGKKPSTTFEDAAEIVALLESRGVRNIALRFSGANKNGLASDSGKLNSFDGDLGGKDGFNLMASKITDSGDTVWLDVNLCTESFGFGKKNIAVYDTASKFAGYQVEKFSLNNVNEINSNISKSYKALSSLSGADVCLNDASFLLYTDLQNGVNRQQMLENMREKCGALSVDGGLMLSYPAVYLMNQADAVFSIPDTAACAGNEGVTEVPILQMVLHGSVIYGSSYMNVTNYSAEDAILKAIEYGSAPSFLFTHDSSSNLNYSVYASQTAQLYSDAKALLPVMDMKITSHEVVVSGVYKVTYDYSKVVYVNYNPSVVEVNGIMISAKDYVII